MALDASIISGLKPLNLAQPDPIDRYVKLAGVQEITGKLADQERTRADEQAVREAYQQSGGDSATLRKLLTERGAYKQVQAVDKADYDRRQAESNIAKNTAQGAKATWEVEKERAEHGANLAGMGNAQNWEQIVRFGITAKYWSPEAGAQLLQQGYSPQLVEQLQRASVTYAKQKELEGQAATRAQTRANDPFVAGPDGQPVAQPAVQAYQTAKAHAGAPKTSVSVSTEKKYGEQFAGKIAESDVALRDSAQKAPDLAQRANQMKQIIASGKVITGTGADYRLAVGKALNLAGASDAETIANTEALSVDMARNTLDAIKASGLGSGSGFSNADRDFLEKAAGGKITLEGRTIDRLATLAHRAAEQTARRWSERVRQIPRSAIEGTGVSTDPVQVTPLYQAPGTGAPVSDTRQKADIIIGGGGKR